MTTVTMRFRNFWPGFVPHDFFVPLVEGIHSDIRVQIADSGPVDLEIVSVFDSRNETLVSAARQFRRRFPHIAPGITGRLTADESPDPMARASIWFTGENVRPPVGDWDLTMSFDADTEAARNAYLPLWWFQFPELLAPAPPGPIAAKRYAHLPALAECLSDRPPPAGSRSKFACAIIGNPEPVRLKAVEALQHIGQVDVLGRITGRPVDDKIAAMREYRFALCFENDVYPGYVTEKVIDAWTAGCIPIWNGLDPHGYINPAAVVNLAAVEGLDALVAAVAAVEADRATASALVTAPLLLREPSLAGARRRIEHILMSKAIV